MSSSQSAMVPLTASSLPASTLSASEVPEEPQADVDTPEKQPLKRLKTHNPFSDELLKEVEDAAEEPLQNINDEEVLPAEDRSSEFWPSDDEDDAGGLGRPQPVAPRPRPKRVYKLNERLRLPMARSEA